MNLGIRRAWLLGMVLVVLAAFALWRKTGRAGSEAGDRSQRTASQARSYHLHAAPSPAVAPLMVAPDPAACLGSVYLRHAGCVKALAFSPDGSTLASAGDDRFIRIWSTGTGQPVAQIDCGEPIGLLAFVPDGSRLISASSWRRRYHVWDVSNGTATAVLVTPADTNRQWYNPFAVSPDGYCLATLSGPDRIQFWDIESIKPAKITSAAAAPLVQLAFTPDGASVVGLSRSQVAEKWTVATGEACGSVAIEADTNAWFNPIAIEPGGEHAVICDNRGIGLWDLQSGRRQEFKGTWSGMAAFSPDGNAVISMQSHSGFAAWEMPSRRRLAEGLDMHAQVTAVAAAPGCRFLACGGYDGMIRLFDSSGRELFPHTGHVGSVRCIAWSVDGNRIATGGDDRTVRTWDVRSGRELAALPVSNEVAAIGFMRDGRLVMAAGERVSVHDAGDGRCLRTEKLDISPLNSRATVISTGADRLAAGAGENISVWQIGDNYTRLSVVKLPGGEKIMSVALSPDGRWLGALTQGSTNTLMLIDAVSGAVCASQRVTKAYTVSFLPGERGQPLRVCAGTSAWQIGGDGRFGRWSYVHWPAAAADSGELIAEAHSDGLIRLMRILPPPDNYGSACDLKTRPNRSTAMAFAPGSQKLAAGGEDGLVLVWHLDRASSPAKSVPASDGPSVHIPFDGTVSGVGIASMAVTGNDGDFWFVDGPHGEAVFIDNELEVQCSKPQSVGAAFTFEFWFCLDAAIEYGPRFFQNIARSDLFGVDVRGNGELLIFLSFERRGGHSQLSAADKIGAITPGLWYHLAVTVDRDAGKLSAYIGGKSVVERFDRNRFADELGRLKFGGKWPPSRPAQPVGIDGFNFYPYARTADEIARAASSDHESIWQPETPPDGR